MDIRNSLDGLKSLLGNARQPRLHASSPRAAAAHRGRERAGQRPGDVEQRGSEVSQTAPNPVCAWTRWPGIQAALAAGTYNVPASAVASKVVDAMLGAANSNAIRWRMGPRAAAEHPRRRLRRSPAADGWPGKGAARRGGGWEAKGKERAMQEFGSAGSIRAEGTGRRGLAGAGASGCGPAGGTGALVPGAEPRSGLPDRR
jgi:hypothetical protein